MSSSPDKSDRAMRVRTGVVVGLFWLALLAVVVRVGYLQVYQGEVLDRKGEAQTEHTVELKAKRGSIFDRNGTELAVSVEVPSLYARPSRMNRPRRAARQLLPHLDSGFSALVETLKQDKHFVWLERKVKPATAEAIRTLGVESVESVSENKRFYPLRRRASQLIGFVGLDGEGLAGIEKSFNDVLEGDSFELEGIQDARGRSLITNDVPKFRKLEGKSLQLTVSERIQSVTERRLAKMVEKSKATSGSAVIVDVDTGDILSIATVPGYDPNRFSEYPSSRRRLRAVTDTFEPGSVVKPFVLAGALEEGNIRLDTTIDAEDGRLKIGRHVVRDTHDHEQISASEVIKYSSNIGIYKIAKQLGREKLHEYYARFGFGTQTGIQYPGERDGVLRSPGDWAEVTFANISFGQGFTATLLQLVSAMGAIANDGILMKPRLVDSILDKNGEVVSQPAPKVVRRVVSPQTARRVKRTMDLVVSEDGTGTKAKLENFETAGKTGTAQKVNPETLEYDSDLWMASFGGFAPVEKPEVAAFVAINEPKDGHYGGKLAAPVFRDIVHAALSIRGVQADKETVAGDKKERTDDKETVRLETTNTKPDASSESKSEDSSKSGIPDFYGLSLSRAIQKAKTHGLEPRIEGWGVVVEQSPSPKKNFIAPHRKIELVLKPPSEVAAGSPNSPDESETKDE
jgi:cell division protein FtsI (penicillin-binding protein 3)